MPNLRWRGAWVQADMDRVAFLNCDFRGTLFDGCRMKGLSFVNCLLDGTIFSDCLFVGPQADVDPHEGWSEEEPDFLIDSPVALGESFLRYRNLDGARPDVFLSNLPGTPALPYQGQPCRTQVRFADPDKPVEARRLVASLPTGGAVIYGGRVSTLVVRGCYFDTDGGLSLRHSTGSGIELVEIRDSPGRVEIFGSALRHISVSADPSSVVSATINLKARVSTLAEVYVGKDLDGNVEVVGSTLFHAWNGSPGAVDFRAIDCLVHGTLDVAVEGGARVGTGPQSESLQDVNPDGSVADRMDRMDYRRNPAALRERTAAG